MQLNYKATSRDGKVYTGVIEAKDARDAAGHLRERGLLPINISPKRESEISAYIPFINKVGEKEISFFTQQLASMLTAGLTLMQSLSVLKEQIENKTMKAMVAQIVVDIEGGSTFHQALSKHPKYFSPVYISLVKASESSGLMDKVVTRLSENIEKHIQLKSTIKGAMLYPIIVVIGMGIVTAIMMIFIIPQLSILYEGLGVELPLPTKIVIGFSRALVVFWPFALGFIALAIFLFRRWRKTEIGGLTFDKVILHLPVIGKLTRAIILTESTRTMGLLIASGGSVVDALQQTADVSGNRVFRSAFLDIAKRVEKGVSMGAGIEAYPIFPVMISQMARIGEQTGKLDEAMSRVAEYYQREVDQKVKNLTTALEPIIMLILGIGVAFLIISIITPIYSLTSAIK